MGKIDYHVHTTFSPDGADTPERMLAAAEAAGLCEICFTDHFECNGNDAIPPEFEPWPAFDADAYFARIESLKGGAVRVKTGVELGQATQSPQAADAVLCAHEWDFVLGSLHNLKGDYDFYYLSERGADLRPLMRDYFEQLYALARFGRFNVLSHLYYPVKYIYRQGHTLDLAAYRAEIADIFRVVIESGKGVEVNTSALETPFRQTVPCLEDLKLYRRLGGQIVTVGSDCHDAGRVGAGVETALAALREAGFGAVTVFERQKPVFTDI